MKKFKLLLGLNIAQAAILVAAIVTSIFVLPKLWVFEDKPSDGDTVPVSGINGTDNDIYNGYADITDYGAVPNDGKDDTAAFEKALKTGASLYIPKGEFNIAKTIELDGVDVKGAGSKLSVIRAEKTDCIFAVSGSTSVSALTLGFADGSVTGSEKSGEKVAFKLVDTDASSIFTAVSVDNVGTAFYGESDGYTRLGTLQNVNINNFSFAAVEVGNALQTVIRSTVVTNEKYEPNFAVRLGGMFTLESVHISALKTGTPIVFENATAATAKALTFSGVTAADGALLKSKSSNVSIWSVSALESTADALIVCEDGDTVSTGSVTNFYSDSAIGFGGSEKIELLD